MGDPAAARTRRLMLIGGLVAIAGLPLLFAVVWLVVWTVWKKDS